jgi:fumarate reductase subunit D
VIACCQTAACPDSKPAGQGKVESDCGERIKLAVDDVRKQLADRYSKVSVDAWGIKVSYDSGGGVWNAIFTLVVLALIFGGVAFAASVVAKKSRSKSVRAGAFGIAGAAILIGLVFLVGFLVVQSRLSGIHHELQNTKVELDVSKDANTASIAEVRFLSAQLASTQTELEAARAELRQRDTARTWLDMAGVAALTLIAIAVLLAATVLHRSRASVAPATVEPSDTPLLKARRVRREPAVEPPEPKHVLTRGWMWRNEVRDAVSTLYNALLPDAKVESLEDAHQKLLREAEKRDVREWLDEIKVAAQRVRQRVEDIIAYAEFYERTE